MPGADHESTFGFPLKKGTVFQNLTATVSIGMSLPHKFIGDGVGRIAKDRFRLPRLR
jgi:hypothetical protein